MENKKVEANISMVISKVFSGLNMNALKYLLPFWMTPLTGVPIRCVFAAIAFWIIGLFAKPETSSAKDKFLLFLLGALGIYGFMFFYLVGLSKTTPVSSSIFSSLQPIWVFLIAVLFFKERITSLKVLGILVGLGGALLCIFTQKSDGYASDAFMGNMLCLVSSLAYAIYLVVSNRILKSVGVFTMLRYTFSGAAFSSLIVIRCSGVICTYSLAAFSFIIVCAHLSNGYQLSSDSHRTEISENNFSRYLWLLDFDCCNCCFTVSRAR